MNNKGSGRRALNVWVVVSEGILYSGAFVAFRGLGIYSFLVCLSLFLIQAMAILKNKRNVLAKINRLRKAKTGLVAFFGVIIIFKDVMNGVYWLVALAFLVAYGLCSAYAANLYRWVLRWEDMIHGEEGALSHQVTLTNMDFDVMTHKNGVWVLTRMFPSLLVGGIILALLWISPLVQWVLYAVKSVLLKIVLVMAYLIWGLVPDELFQKAELETSGDAVTPDPMASFFQEVEKMSHHGNFQSGYEIIGIIITVLLITAIGFYAYKASRKKALGVATLQATQGGVFEKIQMPFTLENKSVKGKSRQGHDSDLLLRKKYRQLLKKLAQRGYPILDSETPDQIRTKLLMLYPNQEERIQIITDAYCERRYADREPKNMEEILHAFSLLKEDNYDRS